MQCALCKVKKCAKGQNCPGLSQEVIGSLYSAEDRRLLSAAADVESQHYMKVSRIEESVMFAKEMGCSSIGLAFCIGLANEAGYIAQYFQKFFTVHSVCCKICGSDKEQLELVKRQSDQMEVMCNPAIQAKVLNNTGTELNFSIGLCIAHEMIFNRYSNAPVASLVAKDHVLAHNPLGAVYSANWRKMKLGPQLQ